MDSSVSPKDEIWFVSVCHHISDAVYILSTVVVNSVNVYRVRRCCIVEMEMRNTKTPPKDKLSILEENLITDKSFINLACLE